MIAALLLSAGLSWHQAPVLAGITKSANDDRQYEALSLANGLKVLVVSDPGATTSAASMDVAVGSGSDPEDRQGLAHFLEHMLFLGTKKYPQPDEYQAFISAHGGRHNAYTAYDHTNYFFDIDAQYLEPALDRFAQFFIAPLFTPQYVERERNSVNSEYQAKLKDDGLRLYYAWKQAVNPAHPLSRFDIGSLATLADRGDGGVRGELIAFYERHYSANLMALVVLGKEPLPTLKRWVQEKFSSVRNASVEPQADRVPLFAPGRLPARLDVVPLKEQRLITLSFPIPPVEAHYQTKPVAYIANLLGHEGKGSLLSLLKARGWVEDLSAGLGVNDRTKATFEVSMRMTDEGLRHIGEIPRYVFTYLRLIQQQGIKRWIFEEQQRLAELNFRFQEKSSALHYVSRLSDSLRRYPAEDVLRGPYAMDAYDPALIERYLGRLVPTNVLITVSARGLKTDRREPWFDTPYKLSAQAATALEPARVAEAGSLAIPPPNPFIPEDVSVKPPREAGVRPLRIFREPGMEIWFQEDVSFGVPRADFYFTARSQIANDSPRNTILTELYVKLVDDQLNEFAYPAYLAGLDYSLYRHARGFSTRISGYNDKQRVLLERVLEALVKPEIEPTRFARIKDELIRRLRNAKKETPYRQTVGEVTDLLVKPAWTEDERLAAAEALTSADLEAFLPRLLSRLDLVVLAHGNLYNEDALALAALLRQRLLANGKPASVPRPRLARLPAGKGLIRELTVDHPDSALTVYVQGAQRNYATRAKTALAAQLLSSPFYNDLRTEKQRGYVVFVTSMPILEVPGIAFVVQSPGTNVVQLEDDIESFLERYSLSVDRMESAEFERHKEALVSRILEPDQNLQARSDRYWTELDQREYKFDSRERLAKAVRHIDKAGFAVFYRELLLGKQRRWLVIRSQGKNHATTIAAKKGDRPAALLGDIATFKQNASYFKP